MSTGEDWGRGWALVTGASVGLGEEIARVLASRGFPLVITARNEQRLEALAHELSQTYDARVRVIPADLSQPGSADRLASEVRDMDLPVEVLVNNAGIGQWGPYLALDGTEELEMLHLNVEALTVLTRGLLPGMVERGYGRILNVASTAAFVPGPWMTVYYATKAYVLSYSEALGEELRDTGVSVTCLCPGPTRTHFQLRAGMRPPPVLAGRMMEASPVARAGVDGLFRQKRVVVPGLMNRLITFAPRILPRALLLRVVKRIQVNRGREGEG
ncbi:MAG: SDR family oxidoreductase [Gemmatimonadales bacterium]|jgi:short-subunit dehydrogenase|nr:MAG: SDR family oxidoreductase [Gemmatimonadales bacterium]